MGDETSRWNGQRDKAESTGSAICPILTGFWSMGRDERLGIRPISCLPDRCAWRDAVSDRCSVVEIAFELAEISVVIRDIRKQLTEI